jgi:hypothetical protein
MTAYRYDVIVVGARCAGSPTAMLLARAGYRVLVVDRATFPSDTISTHLVHPPGVATLRRWGLLDRLTATGCPPIDTYLFDFGPFTISGTPGTDDAPVAYGPRRTVLDKLLVDAAAEAGAEVREGFTVSDVVFDNDRVIGVRGHSRNSRPVTERARVVVGADGWHSRVAQSVRADQYHDKPRLLCGYYTYYRGLPMGSRFETYVRPDRGFAAWATNDDLTLVVGGWPFAEFEANKKDIEGNFLKMLETGAGLRRTHPGGQPRGSFCRHGRTELLPQTLRSGLGAGGRCRIQQRLHHGAGNHGRLPGRRAVRGSVRRGLLRGVFFRGRDGALPAISTCCLCTSSPLSSQTLEPPPPELARLLQAVHGNTEAMDAFARVNAGVTSPAEFFSPQNVDRIFATAA